MLSFVVAVTLKAVVETEIDPALTLDAELPLHPVFKMLRRHRHNATAMTNKTCMEPATSHGIYRINLDGMN
jgi:hypothetical protein